MAIPVNSSPTHLRRRNVPSNNTENFGVPVSTLFLALACFWPFIVLALYASSAPQIDTTALTNPETRNSLAKDLKFEVRNFLDRVDVMGYGPTHPRVGFVIVGDDKQDIINSVESVFGKTDMNRIFLVCVVADGIEEDPAFVAQLRKMEQGSVPHWHGLKSDMHKDGHQDPKEEESHGRKVHVMFNPEKIGVANSRSDGARFMQLLANKHERVGLKSPQEDLILLLMQSGAQFTSNQWLTQVTGALIVPPPLLGEEDTNVAMKLSNAVSFNLEGPGKRTSFDITFAAIISDPSAADINLSSGMSYPTPALNGAAVAMRLETYLNLPAQDNSLTDLWAADLDLALNLWLCADGIDMLKDLTITTSEPVENKSLQPEMAARFAAVWMDDLIADKFFEGYSKVFTELTFLEWEILNAKAFQTDAFPKDLAQKCRSFEWYVTDINTDLTDAFQSEEKESKTVKTIEAKMKEDLKIQEGNNEPANADVKETPVVEEKVEEDKTASDKAAADKAAADKAAADAAAAEKAAADAAAAEKAAADAVAAEKAAADAAAAEKEAADAAAAEKAAAEKAAAEKAAADKAAADAAAAEKAAAEKEAAEKAAVEKAEAEKAAAEKAEAEKAEAEKAAAEQAKRNLAEGKPSKPLCPLCLEIVQKAKPYDISYVDVSGEHKDHPHMGAQDESGNYGYIHDEKALRKNPPPLTWEENELKEGCDARDNNWKMLTEQVYVDFEGDKKANESGLKRDKIFCLVYTTEDGHNKIPPIRETWGPKCDGFMVASTKTDVALGTVNIPHEGPEEYNNIWQKVRSMWSYIYDNYYEEYDWFHIGGDDLLLIVENLRLYLESEEIRTAGNGGIYLPKGNETKQVPLFLGRRFKYMGDEKDIFNSGGSGYTMNKAALKLLVVEGFQTYFQNLKTFSEDTMIARTFRKYDVYPYETKDEAGGERYMPFLPGHHYGYQIPPVDPNDWYAKYSINIKGGLQHCAKKSVAFHYVKDKLMKRLHALLYHLCPAETYAKQ